MQKETNQPEATETKTYKYTAKKADLISLVSKCQERKFAEDVDFLEALGG